MYPELLKTYFPFEDYNAYQRETIEKIYDILVNSDKKIIFLNAPTGTGKSIIALTIATVLNKLYDWNSYISTTTNILQHQYMDDLEEYYNNKINFKLLKGKSKYSCNAEKFCNYGHYSIPKNYCTSHNDGSFSSEKCFYLKSNNKDLKKDKCIGVSSVNCYQATCNDYDYNDPRLKELYNQYNHCDYTCTHKSARRAFINSDIGVINYDLLFSRSINALKYHGEGSTCRDLLIMDEAHHLSDKLCEYYGNITISEKNIKRWFKAKKKIGTTNPAGVPDTKEVSGDFNINYLKLDYEDSETWEDNLQLIINELSKFKHSVSNISKKSEDNINYIIEKLTDCKDNLHSNPDNFVIDNQYKGEEYDKTLIQRLTCEDINNQLFKYGNKLLLMSATFKGLEKELNRLYFNPENVAYIDIPETRPLKEKNPIFLYSKRKGGINMASQSRKNHWNIAKKKLYEILNEHPNEKGIIQVTTESDSKKLVKQDTTGRLINYSSTVNTDNPKYRDNVINYFKSTDENKVLVSHSIFEGFNFPDDECRFQIFLVFKQYWDKYYKKLNDKFPNYSYFCNAQHFIQSTGRGYRHENDYCENHVIDTSAGRRLFYEKSIKPMLSSNFQKSMRWVK